MQLPVICKEALNLFLYNVILNEITIIVSFIAS